MVTHQQLRVYVAHQKVSPQQWQPHALHQLAKTVGEWVMSGWRYTELNNKKGNGVGNMETKRLTQGTCCLRPSISCFTQLNTARYTSSSDGTLRLSLEIKSRTWIAKTKHIGRVKLYYRLQLYIILLFFLNHSVSTWTVEKHLQNTFLWL